MMINTTRGKILRPGEIIEFIMCGPRHDIYIITVFARKGSSAGTWVGFRPWLGYRTWGMSQRIISWCYYLSV